MRPRTSRGGFFNLKYGRPHNVVRREVQQFLEDNHLDWCCTQETNDYLAELSGIPGWNVCAGDHGESAIMTRDGIPVVRFNWTKVGDGWTTVRGGHHPPREFPRVTLDGWLRVGCIHLPTPTSWDVEGRLNGPANRVDDYMDFVRQIERFLRFPDRRTRVAAGDWNEPPTTQGNWTPYDIAARAHAQLAFPKQRQGHGRIDGAIINRGYAETWKDLKVVERSDHEPGVLVVHNGWG